MARSTKRSNQRPDTLMQDRISPNSKKSSCNARPDHTFGSFATEIKSHVRSMPNSGARADIAGLPRRASSGLMQSSNPGADKLRRHACFIQPKLSAVVGQVIDRLWDTRY